ncbi:hypothetical protein [Streptomyces sp. NPDC001914]|uniref:hypothetical protein n=1 Tax=Streptomyces sp. NPDC001914 TaxID=3364623 RepID=UPI003676A4A3
MPATAAPAPSPTSRVHLAQNLAAADLTLTADDLARITGIAPDGGLGGRLR